MKTPHPVALVTGASSGIGQAVAQHLSRAGYALVLCARREERLQQVARQLTTPTHVMPLDVRDGAALQRAVETLPGAFSAVDVLVHSAGLALGTEPATSAHLPDWQQMVDTNISAVMHLTRLVLPGMTQRQRGHVVMMGSVAGTYPYPGGNVYGATKAFVHQFALNLRADLQGSGVRVTSIEPGMVETEFSVVRFKGDQQKADKVYQGMQPLTAQDIADAVVWCVTRPSHVNINVVELMPTQQAFNAFNVHRNTSG
jgi:3-hydroxy acid dehydrogenase/malonic semialdehyde reductase